VPDRARTIYPVTPSENMSKPPLHGFAVGHRLRQVSGDELRVKEA
jgi:hypothetical protein